jgi:hypothetical protein
VYYFKTTRKTKSHDVSNNMRDVYLKKVHYGVGVNKACMRVRDVNGHAANAPRVMT